MNFINVCTVMFDISQLFVRLLTQSKIKKIVSSLINVDFCRFPFCIIYIYLNVQYNSSNIALI